MQATNRRWQCVTYVRYITGNQNIKGSARNIIINSDTPADWGIVKTNEGPINAHLAVYRRIGDLLYLDEANLEGNLEKGGIVRTDRVLNINDPIIEGYL